MKLKVLSSLIFVALLSVILSSYIIGPNAFGGWECTSATGTTHGCSGSNGGITCHSNVTTDNNVVVELDSAGTPVKSYYPGGTYIVKLSGTNGTGQNLPKFGFQLTAAFLAGSGVASTVREAGYWDSAAITGNVHYEQGGGGSCQTCSEYNVPIIEHSTQLPATTGTGANGTTYVESFTWSAPASGSGAVVLYGIINAVNNDGTVTGDYNQGATDTIAEAVTTDINNINYDLSGFTAYPTVMNENVTLSFTVKESSNVSVSLISMEGQTVKTFMSQESLPQGSFRRNFDVNGLATGVYLVRVQIGNESLVSKVIKE